VLKNPWILRTVPGQKDASRNPKIITRQGGEN
jgi:hypothetical protein